MDVLSGQSSSRSVAGRQGSARSGRKCAERLNSKSERSVQSRVYGGETVGTRYVSTGRLPPAEQVEALVLEAYERYRSNAHGQRSAVYPVLARAPEDSFGICVAGTSGRSFTAGDVDHEFSIMSVAKPFVFALVCDVLGTENVRRKVGVNGTGLAFNSLAAVERAEDGRTNPMVNPGAMATTSLVPGATIDAKWHFILDGLSRFAGRPLRLDDEVYGSASDRLFVVYRCI